MSCNTSCCRGGRRGDDAEKKPARFLLLDPFVRRGLFAGSVFENLLVEISHALFLSANVEGAIAANGEEPFRGRGIDLPPFAALQLDKRFLHDIPRAVTIAEDARGILEERQFEAAKERRQVVLIGWDWFGHAHKLFTSSNAPAAELLTKSYKRPVSRPRSRATGSAQRTLKSSRRLKLAGGFLPTSPERSGEKKFFSFTSRYACPHNRRQMKTPFPPVSHTHTLLLAVCFSSLALILSSAVCRAQCGPNIKADTTLPEETPDYIYQPPPPNAFNILHRKRFVPPPPYAPPFPTVLMLPPDLFYAEYGDSGVPSEKWATYDLQQEGFLVFQVDHRLAPPNTLPGQATDGGPPFQTDDLKRQILAALADPSCNGSIYLVGGSAGGTLVLWCALDPATGSVTGWSESTRAHIKAVVSLSGPADFCDLDSNPGGIPPSELEKFKNTLDNYVRLPDGTDCGGDPNGNLMHASPKWLVTNGATSNPPPIRLYATERRYCALLAGEGHVAMPYKCDFLGLDVVKIHNALPVGSKQAMRIPTGTRLNDADNSDGRCVSQQVIDFLKAH